MGGDGGCVNTRADMVKTRGFGFMRGVNCGGMGITPNVICRVEEDRLGACERRRMHMTHCRLSQVPLRKPIVTDRLGALLNKEALVEGLLGKSMPENLSHIRSLKDIKEVSLTMDNHTPVCPVTKRELNDGGCRSVALWSCGCVVEQKAWESVGKKVACPVCGVKAGEGDAITLAPDEEELKEMRQKLPARQKKRAAREEEKKEEKEEKEKKKAKTEGSSGSTSTVKASKAVASMFRKDTSNRDGFGNPSYFGPRC